MANQRPNSLGYSQLLEMAYLFSYTECEGAGPFQQKPGFKIQSLSAVFDAPQDKDLEKILNITIANFPNFDPPKVDAYASRSDFECLTKVWSFQPVASGHMAFVRLATSGNKMGRPDNPFHQAFVVKYQELNSLFQASDSIRGLKNLTPADLYFWDWPSPRGDAEVEAERYAVNEFPVPRMSELDLSDLWDQGLISEDGSEGLSQFESRWLTGSSQYFHSSERNFFCLLSFLLRLIPLEYSWAYPFGNFLPKTQPEASNELPNAGVFLSTEPVTDKSEQSVFWADLVGLVVENGIQLEVIQTLQSVSKLFDFSVRNQRQALAFLPLAVLVLPDPNHYIRASGLRSVAWHVLQDVGVRMEFKSQEARNDFTSRYLVGLAVNEIPADAELWLRDIGVVTR